MRDERRAETPAVQVSVIIPAFNRAASITRAIKSIQAPDTVSYELIVVDDGSSDNTVERAQKAIDACHGDVGRVIRQANAGPGAARNTGAKAARGCYLAFLDSDDFWFPQTLSACFDFTQTRDAPALIFLQTIDLIEGQKIGSAEDNLPVAARFDGFLQAVAGFPGTRYGSCNVVVRRDVYEMLGGFTDEVRCSEDTDLFFRAASAGECFVLSGTPLVGHVSGADQRLTGRFSDVLKGYEFLLVREREGLYPDPTGRARLRDLILTHCTAHTIKAAFATGDIGTAYRLYRQSLPRLWRTGRYYWLIRLPLTPLLAVLRPKR